LRPAGGEGHERTELRTVADPLLGGGAVGAYLLWGGVDGVAARFAGLVPRLAVLVVLPARSP